MSSAQHESSRTQVDQQHGLEWVQKTFGLEPRWTVEPCVASMVSLSRQHLQLSADAFCSVQFFNQGGFNKLYRIESDAGTYLMRVALPVDPKLKTASEVATMEFVNEHTHIALPSVKAYSATNQNKLGFEWMLMDLGPLHTLKASWRSLSMPEKHRLVESLAAFQADLFDCTFEKIGNLYRSSKQLLPNQDKSFELGPMVTMAFFWGDCSRNDAPRGPFRNSFEWLNARLQLIEKEQSQILEASEDESAIEDAEASKSVVEKLRRILLRLFDPDCDAEKSVVFHDDLSMSNILVDEHKLPFVVDWECVSTLPLWAACQFPRFLTGRTRAEEPPKLEDYGTEEVYWEDLLEYERWQLRRAFVTKMGALRPEWMEEHREGALKRDFEHAVQNCNNAFALRRVEQWCDAYLDGEPISFEGLFYL